MSKMLSRFSGYLFRHIKPYRGAGVLFYHRNAAGQLEILSARQQVESILGMNCDEEVLDPLMGPQRLQ